MEECQFCDGESTEAGEEGGVGLQAAGASWAGRRSGWGVFLFFVIFIVFRCHLEKRRTPNAERPTFNA
jgi:hypothetical protein